MPNNSKLRRNRKALAKSMQQYLVNTGKPKSYPKVVGNAPGVTKAVRAKRRLELMAVRARKKLQGLEERQAA